MTEDETWEYLVALDKELLHGGVVLSEWCAFIVRGADTALANGAYLASILLAVAAIETQLRAETPHEKGKSLFKLIQESSIDDELRREIHTLRLYRNKWVHVEDPWDDYELIGELEKIERELESVAFAAARTLRRTLYENASI